MAKRVEIENVAHVWCGKIPRKGSKQHMWTCKDCKRARKEYWKAVHEQSEIIANSS